MLATQSQPPLVGLVVVNVFDSIVRRAIAEEHEHRTGRHLRVPHIAMEAGKSAKARDGSRNSERRAAFSPPVVIGVDVKMTPRRLSVIGGGIASVYLPGN